MNVRQSKTNFVVSASPCKTPMYVVGKQKAFPLEGAMAGYSVVNNTVCADTKQPGFSSRATLCSLTEHNVGIVLHTFLTFVLQLLCFRVIGGCLLNNGRF